MPTLVFKNENDEHVYELDGVAVPSVTQALQGVGLINFDGVPAAALEYARNRGSLVHQALHYRDEGDLDLDTVDPALTPYLDAYEKFCRESYFMAEEIEMRVFSETYKYAGTLDRIGVMGDKRVLIDIKTGQIDRWVSLQLWGYQTCLEEQLDHYALQLTGDGNYKLHKFGDWRDRGVWLAAVSLYHWKGI